MIRRENKVEELLQHSIPSAPRDQALSACDRVLNHLRSDVASYREAVQPEPVAELTATRGFGWRWVTVMTAAAALVLFVIWSGVDWRPNGLSKRETIRSNATSGRTFMLADGSRVEMRSNSELVLDHGDDGARIRLSKGSVIVNAAKQLAGRHLYVQTRDITVSVVGTVFMVNAEEAGSRVAVIEGEVRVRQGELERSLRSGEHVETNPSMPSPPVKEELYWSRHAETHIALLQQSAAALAEPRVAFEEVSIRVRQGGGGGSGVRGQAINIDDIPAGPCESVGPARTGPGAFSPQLDPRRFAVSRAGLLWLITVAYGLGQRDQPDISCRNVVALKLLSEGPEWVKSLEFDIEALIPQGTPAYTIRQLYEGEAPEIQKMLQAMLAERFKLLLRRDSKEMPVYVLSVAAGGATLTPAKARDGVAMSAGTGPFPGSLNYYPPKYNYGEGTIIAHVSGHKASMDRLAGRLQRVTQRPVFNRTNILGDFDFEVIFSPDQFYASRVASEVTQGKTILPSPSLFKALEVELGLKLEDSRGPVEAFVIEHVERPSEN